MRLVTVVVLGAGDIAAATARQLAAARLATRVIMVDEAASVAQGKALDITQAAPVDRYDTVLVGTSDEAAVVGASVVVLADRAGPAGEWSEEAGLALVRRVAGLNEQAALVCAGVRQRSIVDRAVHELGLPRTRIFGTAPEALRGAIAALVALEAEVAPGDISILVVGRAPHDIIISWDSVSLNGRRAIDVLPPPVITRMDARAAQLWPPGPHALGSAATRVIRSMLTRAARTHVLEVALTRDEAAGGRPAMLPARVGPRGILRLESAPLSARDRVRLDSTLAR
jgi:malate dehydrogenase